MRYAMNVKNILSLTDFKKIATKVIKKIQKEKTPFVLTVDGAAAVVVVEANEYEKMKEYADLGYILKGVENGLESMEKSKGEPKDRVFLQLKRDINEVLANMDTK